MVIDIWTMVDGCLVAKTSVFLNRGASSESSMMPDQVNPIPKPPRANGEDDDDEDCEEEDASGEFEHHSR